MFGNFFSSVSNFVSDLTESISENPFFKTIKNVSKIALGPSLGLYGMLIFGLIKMFAWTGKTVDSKITTSILGAFNYPKPTINRDQWWQQMYNDSSKNFDESFKLLLFPFTKGFELLGKISTQHLAETGRGDISERSPLPSEELTTAVTAAAIAPTTPINPTTTTEITNPIVTSEQATKPPNQTQTEKLANLNNKNKKTTNKLKNPNNEAGNTNNENEETGNEKNTAPPEKPAAKEPTKAEAVKPSSQTQVKALENLGQFPMPIITKNPFPNPSRKKIYGDQPTRNGITVGQ